MRLDLFAAMPKCFRVLATALALAIAAGPASASSLPAPSLSGTAWWCTASLTWTHSNPNGLNIYTFQYRASKNSGTTWESWTNISGGAAARSVDVFRAEGGSTTFKVRAIALTVGDVIFGSESNSVTINLVSSSHERCVAPS